jgi:hypothetical protein
MIHLNAHRDESLLAFRHKGLMYQDQELGICTYCSYITVDTEN